MRTAKNILTIRANGSETHLPNGSVAPSYLLAGYHRGKRIRIRGDLATLTSKKRDLELEVQQAPETRLVRTWLTEAQLRDAEAACTLADGRRLVECVRTAPRAVSATRKPLAAAVEAFFADLGKLVRRPRTVDNLNARIGAFLVASGFAKLRPLPVPKRQRRWAVDEGLSAQDVVSAAAGYVRREGVSDRMRVNDYAALHRFFGFLHRRGWISELPAMDRRELRPVAADPRILSAEQAGKLLAGCTGDLSCLTPYVVLGLWGFMRPRELGRLTWASIDLDPVRVRIGRDTSKTRQFRILSLPAEAKRWLEPHRGAPIYPDGFKEKFNRLRKAAGLLDWQNDILRHTGISYHYAKAGDLKSTCKNAGNSTDVLFRHYLDLATPEEAERFYGVLRA